MPCDCKTAPPDCSKLRSAVDDAAGVTGTLWLSFIFLLFYVLLAIVGVTHVDQFLQNTVKLPFLQIELPMLGFCWIGPVIVLLAHAYVLHHLTLLAATARLLNACEEKSKGVDTELLGISLFAQILSGPTRQNNFSAWVVEQIIVWVTLVIAPVLTLMYFELQFLPSHDGNTTWWARGFMLADLTLLWWLWPRAICRADPPGWFIVELGPVGIGLMALLTLSTSYVAILLATFPGEPQESWNIPLHETLIVGTRETGGDKRLIQPLWPNRLFVQGIDVIDHVKYDTPSKIAMAPPSKSMRDRNLEYAIIIEAQLARADFTGAHLQGASLVRAHAMGAWFDHADLTGTQFYNAELQGASFFSASMAGATMEGVQLQGGRLAGANLRAAWLRDARLDGASLAGADLRRATLDGSWLVGANLKEARLQGASLADTHLEAASLDGAFVWSADFRRADSGKGVRHLNTSDKDTPPCLGPPVDACKPGDDEATLKADIRKYVPNTGSPDPGNPQLDSRQPLFDQLDKPLSANKENQDRLASFSPLNDKDLPQLWEKIACISKGAPFVIAMLIDTYGDEKGWTRPTTRTDTKAMVTYLLDQKQCTANLAVTSDLMKMDLLDLPLLRPQPPSLLQIASGLRRIPFGDTLRETLEPLVTPD